MEVFILGRLRIAMQTKKLPITPRSTMVDHKLIWNTVAPNGWWRYSGKPGAVVCATLCIHCWCIECLVTVQVIHDWSFFSTWKRKHVLVILQDYALLLLSKEMFHWFICSKIHLDRFERYKILTFTFNFLYSLHQLDALQYLYLSKWDKLFLLYVTTVTIDGV